MITDKRRLLVCSKNVGMSEQRNFPSVKLYSLSCIWVTSTMNWESVIDVMDEMNQRED